MTLYDLITRFRVLANDKSEPFFWSDEEVADWLNDAVHEACIRGRLLHKDDAATIEAKAGQSSYPYNAMGGGYVYEIDSIRFESEGKSHCLKLVSPEVADTLIDGWRTGVIGEKPKYAIQSDEKITLAPAPKNDGTVFIGGYCLPKQMVDDSDEPEINAIHHRNLVYWALQEAFSVPDAEVFDPQRSDMARQKFERYFGLPTDSDLRRITREDVLHTNKPFWI